MDKRTRVFNALDKKPVDHVPVGFWYHFAGEQAVGEGCVKAHKDYVHDCALDMLKIMCDGYFPYPVPEDCKTASDWKNLKPLGKDHPFIKEQLERARRLVEEVGKEMPVFYNVFAPFSSIRFGAGEDRVMHDIREDKLVVVRALDVIAQDNALLAELLITEAGCDGVYYCVQGGEKDRMTGEDYRAYITPSDKAVLSHANKFSPYNILHCCGWAGIPNRLENWQDYPAKVINWAAFIEKMDMPAGRAFFGGKTVLGGCDNRKSGVLYKGTRQEIQAFIRNLAASFDSDTGYMIGADCTLPGDIDLDHIRWVVDAVNSL